MKQLLASRLSWSILALMVGAIGTPSCTVEQRNFGNTGGSGGSGGTGGAVNVGGGGEGGAAVVCTPDAQQACYTGPMETLEVGLCKSGKQVCLPSGDGFGECGGEVLPQPENCLTPEDEACNGDSPGECPALSDGWIKTFGSAGFAQNIFDVAVTPAGEIVAVGTFADTIDFGVGPMASTGLGDIFVAKFDAFGNALWSKRYGDASSQAALAVTVDSNGGIYVGGTMSGSVDFDGTLLTSAGSDDAFLARFEADGKFSWAQRFGDTAKQAIRRLAVTTTNIVIAAGEFAGTVAFDAAPANMHTAMGGNDIFIARFDASGFVSGSRAFGGTATETVRGLALNAVDEIYMTGGFEDAVNFGGTTLTSTGVRDAYVVQLKTTLSVLNTLQLGNPNGPTSFQEGYDVAVNDAGGVVITGGFISGIDIDGTFLSNPQATSRSLYIAVYGPQLMGAAAAKMFGGIDGNVVEGRLALDRVAKQVVLAGYFTGTVDFGVLKTAAIGASDPYLAKFDTNGNVVAARTFPNNSKLPDDTNTMTALSLLQNGDLIVGGTLRAPIISGSMEFGQVEQKFGDAWLARILH